MNWIHYELKFPLRIPFSNSHWNGHEQIGQWVCVFEPNGKRKKNKKIQTKKDQLNREDEKGYPDALGKWFDKKRE